jgi:hypothetical protein
LRSQVDLAGAPSPFSSAAFVQVVRLGSRQVGLPDIEDRGDFTSSVSALIVQVDYFRVSCNLGRTSIAPGPIKTAARLLAPNV